MRVLVVSSWFPYPPANGAQLRAYHLIREMAERHAITLLSFAEAHQAADGDLAHLRAMCESVTVVRGHPFKHGRLRLGGLFSPMPRALVQTYSEEMQARVETALAGHDVAVGLEVGSALYLRHGTRLARVFEEAEITWLRNHPGGDHVRRRARRALTWVKYRRYIRDLVANFDRTTVVSDVEREAMIGIGCDRGRLRVVPNGTVRANLARPPTPRARTLVYPGAVTYSANYDAVHRFVADVWPVIRRVRPDVAFLVTGSTRGVDLQSLQADGVTFTGHVDDVRDVIAGSAACVVPLRQGGGTRLKIIEAMALGTPVVSTSKGAEGLEVTPGQDILVADRPADLAQQILRLLDDPALANRLAANGRRLVERCYTWDTIGAQLDVVLHEAVDLFRTRAATT
jgi:polysaccharide biosynthesis protein PslH